MVAVAEVAAGRGGAAGRDKISAGARERRGSY